MIAVRSDVAKRLQMMTYVFVTLVRARQYESSSTMPQFRSISRPPLSMSTQHQNNSDDASLDQETTPEASLPEAERASLVDLFLQPQEATEQKDSGAVHSELAQLRTELSAVTSASQMMQSALSQQGQSILSIAEAVKEIQTAVGSLNSPSHAAQPQATIVSNPSADPEDAQPEAATDDSQDASPPEIPNNEWTDIRNAFLQEYSDNHLAPQSSSESEKSTDAVVPEKTEATPEEDLAAAIDAEEDDIEDLLHDLQCNIAPTSENVKDLQQAVINRDAAVSRLVKKLQKKTRSRQTLCAVQLSEIRDGLPEDLAARVNESLEAIDQQLRLGELELSLERARISRQLSNLEETRHRLESNARVFGLTVAEDGTIEGNASSVTASGTKGRRWLGALGFGN